jgi:RNA polymerase sigma factor (sigma-70 family)
MSLDLSAVYLLYRGELVNRLLRIVHCPETARDLVQDSYLVLSRRAEAEEISHPRGFLFRIATNLAMDYLRHRKVTENHVELAIHTEETESPSTEAEVSKAQWLSMLRKAINELPPRCRDAFILNKVHGLSYREVAETLGISESAVEKHIIKGLVHCRSQLGPHFTASKSP